MLPKQKRKTKKESKGNKNTARVWKSWEKEGEGEVGRGPAQ
jgi:hypothetical protein